MKILLLILCAISSALAMDARSVILATSYQKPANIPPYDDPSGIVGSIHNGLQLKYTELDFGATPPDCMIIQANSHEKGGTINVRLGSATGHVLCSFVIPSLWDWYNFRTFQAKITQPATPVTGVQDVVFEFLGNGTDLMNLKSFTFDPKLSWRSDVSAGGFLRESHPNNDAVIKKDGDSILNATHGSWSEYRLVDFGPGMKYLWLEASATTAIQTQNPRRVEFRTGSPTGAVIGTIEIPNTNGLYKPLGLKLPQSVSGTVKLFLSFVGPQGDFFNVRNFRFQHLPPDHQPVIIPQRVKRDPQVITWTPAAPFSLEYPPSNIAPPPPAGDNTDVRPIGSRVEWISPNTWVKYAGHDIVAGANRVSIVASSPISGGGNVEVRIGSPTGTPIATINVQTSWWDRYAVFTAKIAPPPSGPQDVYLRFAGSSGYVLNIESFRFHFDPSIPASPNADRSAGVAPVTVDSGVITGLTHGSWVRYDGVNFGQNANIITMKAATPNKGGAVEVRLNSPTGPHVATVDITHTGSFTNFREFPEMLHSVSGVRTVFLKFVDTHNQGGNLFNLKECIIETKSEPAATPADQGTLTVYPDVPGLAQSPYYTYSIQKVSDLNAPLKQNATNWLNPFAWFSEGRLQSEPYTQNYYGWISGWSHTYCNFEMGENTPIVVKISRKNSNPYGAPAGPIFMANAHPAHKVQSCEIINGDVYVTMKEPALLTVDIDGQLDTRDYSGGGRENGAHAVSIFANPVITDKPPVADTSGNILYINPGEHDIDKMNATTNWNTVYFLPGVHSLFGFENGEPKTWQPGQKGLVSNGQKIYIPGDAIVYGFFETKEVSHTNNVRFYGYGTLSGRYVPHVRDRTWWNGAGSDRPGQNHSKWGTDMDGEAALSAQFGNTPIHMGMHAQNCRFEGITVADPAFHGISEMYGSKNLKKWIKQISWRENTDMGGVVGTTEDCFFRLQDDGPYSANRGLGYFF